MLRARGCVWNSFVIVAFPGALISLIERTVPALPRAFLPLGNRLHTRREEMVAESVYATLPATDFSRQVLSAWPRELAVLTLDGLRWSDLGLPRRLLTTVAQAGLQPTWLGRAAIPA
jgi:hypothetical protein